MNNHYVLVIGAIVIFVAVGGVLMSRQQSMPEARTDEPAAVPAPSPVSLSQPDTIQPSSLCTGNFTPAFNDTQVIDIQDGSDGKRGAFHFVLNQ